MGLFHDLPYMHRDIVQLFPHLGNMLFWPCPQLKRSPNISAIWIEGLHLVAQDNEAARFGVARCAPNPASTLFQSRPCHKQTRSLLLSISFSTKWNKITNARQSFLCSQVLRDSDIYSK